MNNVINPMSENDYDAIIWLTTEAEKNPAIKNAWLVLKKYYDECKEALKQLDENEDPFAIDSLRSKSYGEFRGILENKEGKAAFNEFLIEAANFFGYSDSLNIEDFRRQLLSIADNEKNNSYAEDWIVAKFVRLYHMHVKLAHSARITYIADQGLQDLPKDDPDSEFVRRTVLLSALLHDAGRFYQCIKYNDFADDNMRANEDVIEGLKVDHAIAGYYYSLASALQFHKISNDAKEEEIKKYISEAIAAVAVKYHQRSNSDIDYFDHSGSFDDVKSADLIDESNSFIDYAYEQSKMMGAHVDDEIDSEHKQFIEKFVDKIIDFLKDKTIDESFADDFYYNKKQLDIVVEELGKEIKEILKNMQGKDTSEVSELIVELVSRKTKELSKIALTEEEKENYKKEIEEHLEGMLNHDIATSIEQIYINGKEAVPKGFSYLLSAALTSTMDADKIDILNQRAIGIFPGLVETHRTKSFAIFPPDNKSFCDMLTEFYHFNIPTGQQGEFVFTSDMMKVVKKLKGRVLETIHKQLGDVDVFDSEKFNVDSFVVYPDKVVINNVEYPGTEFYKMFKGNWNEYMAEHMDLEHTNFKQFKKDYYGLLPIEIDRDTLDKNIASLDDEAKKKVYKNLFMTGGLEERFLLCSDNENRGGWIRAVDNPDTDHLVNGGLTGLLWTLNQFIMSNMRNIHSFEFIEKYGLLDAIYKRYEKDDPLIAEVLKEYIDYTKAFIREVLETHKGKTTLDDKIMTEMREKMSKKFRGGNEINNSYSM